ncbi:MAG TPA: alkaline phosphatase family protein [Bdellovibrionales bacterium]|nr:alkaline phosphatase family protein [Bdellovibrionales bacterium]
MSSFVGKTKALSAIFICVLSFTSTAFAEIKTVVLISVDGLGEHLLAVSRTPEIDRLSREGMKAPKAVTIRPTQTIPGHISMLSGLDPARHQNTENELGDTLRHAKVPLIFDLLKIHGFSSIAVVGKEKLQFVLDKGSIAEIRLRTWPVLGDLASRSPNYIEREAIKAIHSTPRPSFIFLHFALPDTIGHWFQWETPIQALSVRWVDHAIGAIFNELQKTLEPESFVVIVTADHGGHAGSHGQTTNGKLEDEQKDLYIPWIIYGAKLKPGISLVHIEDTAPTIAALFGLKVPESWEWQGHSVVDVPNQKATRPRAN